jgi:hypothetical protein
MLTNVGLVKIVEIKYSMTKPKYALKALNLLVDRDDE